MRKLAIGLLTLCLGGCAAFEDWVSMDDEGGKSAALSDAEATTMMEMTIMTGRYGVMLAQAREILRLPEPPPVRSVVADAATPAQERAALAIEQTQVANEFLGDMGRACQRRRVPKSLRALACEQQRRMPSELRAPVTPDLAALSMRNDRIGEHVMTWWDAVCAQAPKPRGDDPPACSIE